MPDENEKKNETSAEVAEVDPADPAAVQPLVPEPVLKDLATEMAAQKAYEEKDRMMRNFRYAHLPLHLQDVSLRFAALARWIVDNIPSSPERTVALRKVLEGKDCAVRARIEGDEAAAANGPGRAPGVSGKE